MNKINEASFFLFKSEKKTDEGHWKQMRESLRNILFIWPYLLIQVKSIAECSKGSILQYF